MTSVFWKVHEIVLVHYFEKSETIATIKWPKWSVWRTKSWPHMKKNKCSLTKRTHRVTGRWKPKAKVHELHLLTDLVPSCFFIIADLKNCSQEKDSTRKMSEYYKRSVGIIEGNQVDVFHRKNCCFIDYQKNFCVNYIYCLTNHNLGIKKKGILALHFFLCQINFSEKLISTILYYIISSSKFIKNV